MGKSRESRRDFETLLPSVSQTVLQEQVYSLAQSSKGSPKDWWKELCGYLLLGPVSGGKENLIMVLGTREGHLSQSRSMSSEKEAA